MRKMLLFAAVAALSVSAAACSKKEAPEPTTAATEASVEESSTEASTEETTEEVETDYVSGIITKIDGDTLVVKSLDDDVERTYDIADAELIQDYPFSEGDWVDISFPVGSETEPVPAVTVEVTESMIGQSMDPPAEGKVVDATMNSMTLEVDGVEYPLITANAYIVAKDGITVDKNATVTYLGSLDDDPVVAKVVMEDSYGTPEAEKNAFIGEVAQIAEDGSNIVLASANGDFYTFVSDSIDFTQYKEGDNLEIFYEGSIGDKEIQATEIVKQ
ncbi:MAG: hypothetical protein Q4C73_05005 [Eubacteriales bacterium]|nr:hypothetical protein [Eubacteriales bacterium]